MAHIEDGHCAPHEAGLVFILSVIMASCDNDVSVYVMVARSKYKPGLMRAAICI